MKYLTPELLLRLQDTGEEAKFLAATEAWERNIARYRTRLQSLFERMPRSVRRIVTEFQLHDADVLAVNRLSRRLTITLNLCPPKSHFLVLTYFLADDLKLNPSALPPQYSSAMPTWMYDEFDMAKRPPRQRRPVFAHRILLSNGWEMDLRFWKLVISLPEAILPNPEWDASAARRSVSRSA